MSISRDEITRLDLSDVTEPAAPAIPLATPGEILREEFMEPLGLSANALARALRVPPNRITAILNGTRSITADTALRLSRYFGNSAEFWMGLQADYDLRTARQTVAAIISEEVAPRAAHV